VGPFHEMGHNFQWDSWVLPGTIEAGCNLWSLYLFENLNATRFISFRSDRPPRIAEYLATGPDFAQWNVWTALDTYAQLQEAFGWGLFPTVFAKYRADYGVGLEFSPKLSDQEKIDEWAKRSAAYAGVDLGPFYLAWGFPLSAEVVSSLATLPTWVEDPMLAFTRRRKSRVLTTNTTTAVKKSSRASSVAASKVAGSWCDGPPGNVICYSDKLS